MKGCWKSYWNEDEWTMKLTKTKIVIENVGIPITMNSTDNYLIITNQTIDCNKEENHPTTLLSNGQSLNTICLPVQLVYFVVNIFRIDSFNSDNVSIYFMIYLWNHPQQNLKKLVYYFFVLPIRMVLITINSPIISLTLFLQLINLFVVRLVKDNYGMKLCWLCIEMMNLWQEKQYASQLES